MIYDAMLPFYITEDPDHAHNTSDSDEELSESSESHMMETEEAEEDIPVDMDDEDSFDREHLSEDENPSPKSFIASSGIVIKHIPLILTSSSEVESHKRRMEKIVRELRR